MDTRPSDKRAQSLSENPRQCQLIVRHELLRVARDQRKPGALDLHHDAVALLERVYDTGHHVEIFVGALGRSGTGFSKLLRKRAGKGSPRRQHLITAGRKHTRG